MRTPPSKHRAKSRMNAARARLRPKLLSWPALFFALNAGGLGLILWQVAPARSPGNRLAVNRVSPSGQVASANVTDVIVRFESPLDPATVADDALRLVPAVLGDVRFDGDRELRFELAEPLSDATRYRLALSRELRGLFGELPPRRVLRFSTPPLAVRGLSQAGIEPDGSSIIAVRFSGPVNPHELVEHLEVTGPDGRPVRFEPVGGKPDSTVRIRIPENRWEGLNVRISEGLTGTEGPLPLSDPFGGAVPLDAELRFLGMKARYSHDGQRAFIRVRTNSPVDAAAAGRFVGIEPPVKHTCEPSGSGLVIAGAFEAGERYSVTLKKGLPAGAAGALDADVTRAVWFPDRPRSVRFAFGGGYLSPAGLLKVPVRSVNVKHLRLTVDRLYASNIVEYALRRDGRQPWMLAQQVAAKEFVIDGGRNADAETLVDLGALTDRRRGVYGLRVQDTSSRWRRDGTLVAVTDLGLSARISPHRALVWVTSISTSKPVADARVEIYSDRRQKLGSADTGPAGIADVELRTAPVGEKPELLVASRDGDLTYMTLSRNSRSRGAGSARGRAYLSKGYEAFLFPERGVYRPGDTVRLGGFVRGVSWETPPPMPLELAVVRPDGRELLEKSVMSDRAGRLAAEVTIGAGWPSGRYRAVCRLPGARESLGSTWFCVADYVPRTLRMRLAAPAEPIPTSTPLAVEAHVEHLFGDPAAGLKAACRARYTTAPFRPAGWDDYRFGDARKKRAVRSVDPSRKKLDGEGNAVFTLQAPAISTPAAVRVEVEVEVSEPGGRTLAESLSRRLDPWPFYLGVRAPKAGVAPAEPATFRLAAVAPRGKAHGRAKAVRAALYRVTYSNVLRRRGAGRLEYDWTRHETLVMKREGRLEDGLGTVTMTARHPGPHRLIVESDGGCPATLDFHVRGASSQWAVANPERLHLRLDRASYRPGDVATLALESPFGGTALVCVEADGVVERRVVDLPEGRGAEEFIVDEAWRPNVYLTATLVRPVEPEDEWRPHRASGAVRLDVDCGDRGLDLAVESPGEVRPGREVEIGVRVTAGGRPEAGAAVILAAVDEGVLALTGHRTPSPGGFFYAARRLDVKEYDMFSRLAPELARWRLGKRAEPGGGERKNPELLRRLNPIPAKRVRTVVLYDGTLTTDAGGAARARFTLPEYVGELRVMAWAASGPSFGAAEKSLPVKSPVMLRASWPRFLAPGDVFDVPVTVFNRTADDGRVEVTVSCDGPLRPTGKGPGAVDVSAGGEETVRLRLRAGGVGKAKARVAVSLGGESYGESVEIPVRPPVAFARDGGSAVIEGPGEREIRVRGDFVPGTGRCSIVLAASPIVELTGALDHLLDYPYGCVEQTTSQMVPLVYLRDLAELARPGTVGGREVEALLQAGFLRLRTMQTYRGGLAMWPGRSRPYPYGSLYAADVLVEARKAGWRVPGDLLRPLLDYISGEVGTWASSRDEKERPDRFGHAAYACYVLARAGRPAYAWMGRLEEVLRESDRDGTRLPVAGRFHLAAAYLAAGNRTTAKGFVQRARAGGAARATSGYLSSPVRRTAVMLSVLLDLDPDSARIPRLAHRLKKRLRLGRWGTTQENAFALMALGKYARRLGPSSPEATARVTLPDGATRGFQARRGLRLDDIRPGQSIRVRVEGPGKVHAFWHAEGVPTGGHAAEEDSGMAIRRTFLEATGKRRVGPQDLVQGRLYQVRLVLRANRAVDNAVITDLLPAGLEIENPRLRGSSRLGTEGVKQSVSVQHIERRDDRVLAFGRVPAGRSEFRYVVRAVTVGSFVLPAAEVSCMYDPGLYSVHGRGTVRVSR